MPTGRLGGALDLFTRAAVTLWVGGLWVTGYLVAPVVFATLEDRALAGVLAGRLFDSLAVIGLGCGSLLLGLRAVGRGRRVCGDPVAWIVAGMLALAAVGHWGLQPIVAGLRDAGFAAALPGSPQRQTFAFWHGVASAAYLVESLLGLALVWAVGRRSSP
ncbi:MAG: DUF4149 domain-containing protein [Azospira oryzae]|uniref:DUF4149 domain-containing protein n=1 Tax=Pelomicrobium methylotrophicum TaxID=2602750 RepID=A0A5C7EW83_9PROT|nr:DUF4149 domain-containing protein [Pelomicrobium methylotrophicum]PZP62968.1 MAG: DUF4149 domain-containing protein [Azospira oryzae]PZP81871.1 MAG: DUF4149 domain-containing protein [Azospira oryzae]TXF11340.1 DUF4149 domain-containing protein [Pelomicrobium methylotrophicum]